MAVPQYSIKGNNNPEGLALLLTSKDLNPNIPDHNSPLRCALDHGAVECAQLLLSDHRVDPNIPRGAPLMHCVMTRNEAAVLETYI